MALSAAARAALEQFKAQQANNSNASAHAAEETIQSTGGDSHTAPTATPMTASAAAPVAPTRPGVDFEDDPNSSAGIMPTLPDARSTLAGARMRRPMQNNDMLSDLKATSPVNIDRLATGTSGLFRPEQPKTFKEAGISYRVIEGLILKTIKQEGAMNENQISEALKLGVGVFREIMISLHKRELLDTPAPLHYDLTNKGRELTALLESEDGYVGPAPVSFSAYCQMTVQQAKRERRVSMQDVEEVFANYPMRPELKRTLKEGFNSQRVMLFYGPPGNGKSLITDNLHRLLRDPVILPYAFEFNSRVVQVYDPAYHKLRDDLMKKEEEERSSNITASDKPDRRWLISNPPLVTVGTEFKVQHFEIAYDGQYSAPPHVKANNGIFIFDDLGRQTEDHNMILNQFIYPLEQRESIIRFAGGSTLRVPFMQRLFLSTNLNHEEIIDDAFKRRLLYQVLVDRPTIPLFKEIFLNEATRHGVPPTTAKEYSDNVVDWYRSDDRIIRACDPRNLFTMIDASLDDGERAGDVLDIRMMKRIYDQYPAAYRHEAKFYVGAMDSMEGLEE